MIRVCLSGNTSHFRLMMRGAQKVISSESGKPEEEGVIVKVIDFLGRLPHGRIYAFGAFETTMLSPYKAKTSYRPGQSQRPLQPVRSQRPWIRRAHYHSRG